MLIELVRQLYVQSTAQRYESETDSDIVRRMGSQCLRQPSDKDKIYWIPRSGQGESV
jgi:hypothetical protein